MPYPHQLAPGDPDVELLAGHHGHQLGSGGQAAVASEQVAPQPVASEPEPDIATLEPVAVDESYDIPREPDPTGDGTGSWEPFFDPDDDLDGQLNATGSMLRDAFRSRHNGRRNA